MPLLVEILASRRAIADRLEVDVVVHLVVVPEVVERHVEHHLEPAIVRLLDDAIELGVCPARIVEAGGPDVLVLRRIGGCARTTVEGADEDRKENTRAELA